MLSSTPRSALTIEAVIVGTGGLAAAGRKVAVPYNGGLADGTKLDSSVELRGVG